MAFSSVPTVVTGDLWTAANHNTYLKDNLAAIWVGTTAGDIDYYTGAAAKSRLAIGGAGVPLCVNSGGTAPEWAYPAGLLYTKGTVDFSPGGQEFAAGYADITGATLTLTLAAGYTYTVVVNAVIVGYNDTGGRAFRVRGVVDGTADASPTPFNGGATRNETLTYIYYATGVTNGSKVVKLQCTGDSGDSSFVDSGRIIALAYTE